MLVTNHTLAGAVIGTIVRNPIGAYALGVASHFVMDAIPHYGTKHRKDFLKAAVPDGLTGLCVLALLAAKGEKVVPMLAGALGAATPDLDKPYRLFLGGELWPEFVNRFHRGIQRESHRRLVQEFLVAGGFVLVLRHRQQALRRKRLWKE